MVHLVDEFPLGDPYSVEELRKIIDDAELPGDAQFRIALDETMLDNREPPGGWYVTRTAVRVPKDMDLPVLKLLIDNGPIE